ncbi:hypothetical protein JD844_013233 [Phrynosoma platyrhinos]|uniref:CS domain-containing protein n=1 Tax=Phrynosoma platyrhinos TaxID=52577 RepID=A0ABQ7TKI8_PHRPL|nr:hypothetical protein JD844_013233 [Phrynosoma platyrhinos]
MSSSASVSGQRRTARGADDATNKKKQKDRANQESKEGERPVGSDSKKEPLLGLELVEPNWQRESKEDLLLDWKQNADEVIVKLSLGSGIPKAEEVEASFTDTSCLVKLPDGRQWSCQFYEEIESSCSKIQYKKGNILQLVLQKKIPLHTWASLLKRCKDGSRDQAKKVCKENGKEKPPSMEDITEEPQSYSITEPTRAKRELSNPKRSPGRNEGAGGENAASPGLPTGLSAKRAVCIKASLPKDEGNHGSVENTGLCGEADRQRNARGAQGDALLDLKAEKTERESVPMEMQLSVPPADVLLPQLRPCPEKRIPEPATSSDTPSETVSAFSKGVSSSLPASDTEKRGWAKEKDTLEAVANEPEPTVNLTFVKNDSYEKGNDSMVVHVYVKEINKEMSKVLFREQDFTLLFQTRYGGYWWGGQLVFLLEIHCCNYCILLGLEIN